MKNEILTSDLLDNLSTNQLVKIGVVTHGQYGLEVSNKNNYGKY